MRRCLIIVALVVALIWLTRLAASGPRPPAAPGQQAAAPAPPPAAPVLPIPPQPVQTMPVQPSDRVWEVPEHGFGGTAEAAQQSAVEKARDSVARFLDQRFPELHAAPEAGYLQIGYLKDIGVIRVDAATPRDFHDDVLGRGYEAVAHVDVSDPNLRKMQEKVDEARKKDQEPEVTKRHLLIARILGSFVALFLVIFGYIKLEELTRGYYTTLLRLTAAAVVLLTVAGLFWPY